MIKLVVFDLGGTLIDKYSLSPLVNLNKAFKYRRISLSNSLLKKNMGLKKLDHMYSIAKEEEFKYKFQKVYSRPYKDTDIIDIYNQYTALQRESLRNDVEVIPEAKSIIDYLRYHGIKIGVTSNFNNEHMLLGIQLLKKHDIYIDKAISNHCYDYNNRPNYFMVQDIMNSFGINDPKQVLKVDDTCLGIQEGNQAGCCTVGVARWSTNMDVSSYDEKYNLNDKIINHKLKKTRQVLNEQEPTYLINTLTELKHCIIPLYLKN
tara:strand:+ start:176 stop:961 length:786 start_codon:yes stop_codon:yes gene_type:complete